MSISNFIKRHPVWTYFVLTFAISWSCILLVIGETGAIPTAKEQFEALFPFTILAWFAGPTVTGILVTILAHGKAVLREFLSRLLKWRVDMRRYAVALLSAPFPQHLDRISCLHVKHFLLMTIPKSAPLKNSQFV